MKIVITEEQFKKILGTNGYDKVLLGRFSLDNPFSSPELNEGLIKTFDEKTVLKHLCNYLNFTDSYEFFVHNADKVNGFATIVNLDNNEVGFDIIFPDSKESERKLNSTMALCGYYKSTSDSFCEGYQRNRYEKNFQEKIDNEIIKNGGLVHVTKSNRVEKILRDGLVPRTEEKLSWHPERIYFSLGPASKWLVLSLKSMLEPFNKHTKFTALKVDPKVIERASFYSDPNMPNAVWTTDNIPPQYINVIGEV